MKTETKDSDLKGEDKFEALSRKLARCIDELAVEILKQVYSYALADEQECEGIADKMWEEVSKASVFPSGVTGELWMTVLGVATSEEDVFGLLCRAAVAARQRGVTWADFLLSVLKLKSETVTDENYRLN